AGGPVRVLRDEGLREDAARPLDAAEPRLEGARLVARRVEELVLARTRDRERERGGGRDGGELLAERGVVTVADLEEAPELTLRERRLRAERAEARLGGPRA